MPPQPVLPKKPILPVSALALIDKDGRILLARRPTGKSFAGYWEFPGGKIEADETPEMAIIREIKEEIDIDIHASCLAPLSFATQAYDDFHLLLLLYICRQWQGKITAQEHSELAWVSPLHMRDYDMPPANTEFIAVLQDLLIG